MNDKGLGYCLVFLLYQLVRGVMAALAYITLFVGLPQDMMLLVPSMLMFYLVGFTGKMWQGDDD